MSLQPNTQLQPPRFCKNDGVETGIHVAEGYDLCLDCFREYRAARERAAGPAQAAPAARQDDLFGRAA